MTLESVTFIICLIIGLEGDESSSQDSYSFCQETQPIK